MFPFLKENILLFYNDKSTVEIQQKITLDGLTKLDKEELRLKRF